MVDNVAQDVTEINFFAVVSKVNMIRLNPREWWIDTGANRLVSLNRGMFATFELVLNREMLFMGNSVTSTIKDQSNMIVKMTSGKELTLENVLYVLKIYMNLVFRSLLKKYSFHMIFELHTVVFIKSGLFVGKGYEYGGMFKLSIMTIRIKMNNNINASAYMHEPSNLWHGRLRQINYDMLYRLINLNYIAAFQINYKCETCTEAKLMSSPFREIERNTEPLDLLTW